MDQTDFQLGPEMAAKRIVVAMSGGVDSSVVAALAHATGAETIGVTLQLYDHGEAIGRVVAIDNFGAGDVIEIERPAVDEKPGKRFMVPMRVEAVPEWDSERLVVEASFATD